MIKGNNQTTVTHAMFFAALSTILTGVLAFYQPDLVKAIPGFREALPIVLMGLFTYFKAR